MHGFKTIEEFTLEECEAFLKRNDISDEDRRRVEKRKDWLLAHPSETQLKPEPPQRPKTIAEEFPEYGFVLANTLEGEALKRKSHGRKPITISWIVIAVEIVFVLLYSWSENSWGDIQNMEDLFWILSCIGLPFPVVGLTGLIIAHTMRKKFNPDYISESNTGRRGKRMIFVKNRKFGVSHTRSVKVVVPAQYDKLSWLNDDVLLGRENGKYLLIDKDGTPLTPQYDHITKNDETTLEAVDGEKRFIIDFYGNII